MKWNKYLKKSRRNAAVWFFALIFTSLQTVLLSGCSAYEIGDTSDSFSGQDEGTTFGGETAEGTKKMSDTEAPDIVFENTETFTYASIYHGLANPQIGPEGRLALEYDGGEFAVDYEVSAEGKGRNVGFLLYLNGKPQPYRIGEENDDVFLRTLQLEKDNEVREFRFRFTPVQGKKGETLTLTVASIYNPEFQPDMIKTSSYGAYHEILPFTCQIHFNADAGDDPGTAAGTDHSETADSEMGDFGTAGSETGDSSSGQDCVADALLQVMSAESESRKLTSAFLNEELPANGYNGEITPEQAGQQLYHSLLYGGKIVYDHLEAGDGENVHITYKLCGPAESEYETTFYLNHRPLAVNGRLSFHTKFSEGNMQIIEADLNLNRLGDKNTFYAVTVPVGPSDDMCVKTLSILLYKETKK